MGDKHINVIGNISIVLCLMPGDAVVHKHRYAIDLHVVNCHVGIAEVMHIFIQTANIGTKEAIVVVAADEDFVPVR